MNISRDSVMGALLALLWVLRMLVPNVGLMIAAVLLFRRRTAAQWLILVGFFMFLIASTCSCLSSIAIPVGMEVSEAADRWLFAIYEFWDTIFVLGLVAFIVAIWLLAREHPKERAEARVETPGESRTVTLREGDQQE